MYSQLHISLHQWYTRNGRHDLPWRATDDPYHIWISEIMLQQTQVKTVLERFYFPFLKAFPTLNELAAADVDDVLKQWEGLGYYTRARNLHKAAQLAAPKLPATAHELQQLPGIGKSTAHAIAAFAYHSPVPILDANVKRILYRFFALSQATEKLLWEHAYELFDTERPFDYNQAMMDIGSLICTARKPQCDICPFTAQCQGKHDPAAYPKKKVKKAIPVRFRQIVVFAHQGRFALQQRTGKFLGGLWGFDEFESGASIPSGNILGRVQQTYSHFRLDAEVTLVHRYVDDHTWFTLEDMKSLALSKADHKIVILLRNAAVL
jgi:A/G-specific adenine glycosylase